MPTKFEGDYTNPTSATLLLIAALSVFVVLSEVNIWATFIDLSLWEKALSGSVITDHETAVTAQRKAFVDGFFLFFFTASAVLFFRWFRLVVGNVRALGAVGMRYGPRAALAWWFVPVFHLWKPLQVTKELFQASNPKQLENWAMSSVPRLLSLWWTLWMTFQATALVAIVADIRASTPEQMYMASWGSVIVCVFAAPLGVATAIIAWRLRSLQHARAKATAQLRVRKPWPTRQAENVVTS